jgi:hypothetical protein
LFRIVALFPDLQPVPHSALASARLANGTVIVWSTVQPKNTKLPIVVTLAGIVKLGMPEFWNALALIVVTLAGISKLVRFAVFANTAASIVWSWLPGAKVIL